MVDTSGMSGNGLDNKPYHSSGGVGAGGGLGGAAHYLSARNIHNLKSCHVNNSHNIIIEPRINRTHGYTSTNVTTTSATTATMTTSTSYEFNGLNINTDIVLNDHSNDDTMDKPQTTRTDGAQHSSQSQTQSQQHQLPAKTSLKASHIRSVLGLKIDIGFVNNNYNVTARGRNTCENRKQRSTTQSKNKIKTKHRSHRRTSSLNSPVKFDCRVRQQFKQKQKEKSNFKEIMSKDDEISNNIKSKKVSKRLRIREDVFSDNDTSLSPRALSAGASANPSTRNISNSVNVCDDKKQILKTRIIASTVKKKKVVQHQPWYKNFFDSKSNLEDDTNQDEDKDNNSQKQSLDDTTLSVNLLSPHRWQKQRGKYKLEFNEDVTHYVDNYDTVMNVSASNQVTSRSESSSNENANDNNGNKNMNRYKTNHQSEHTHTRADRSNTQTQTQSQTQSRSPSHSDTNSPRNSKFKFYDVEENEKAEKLTRKSNMYNKDNDNENESDKENNRIKFKTWNIAYDILDIRRNLSDDIDICNVYRGEEASSLHELCLTQLKFPNLISSLSLLKRVVTQIWEVNVKYYLNANIGNMVDIVGMVDLVVHMQDKII